MDLTILSGNNKHHIIYFELPDTSNKIPKNYETKILKLKKQLKSK